MKKIVLFVYFVGIAPNLFSGNIFGHTSENPFTHKTKHPASDVVDIATLESDFELTTTNPIPAIQKEITLKTKDGLIRKGILTTRSNAKGNMVLCHPAAYDKDFMIPYDRKVFSYYNCLRFDFRRHGENNKQQSSTLGKKEIYEVEAAVNYLKNNTETQNFPTYGFGVSLGAVVLLESESQKHQFDGLILQAPFESLREQVKRTFGFFQFPLMHNFIFREPLRIYTKLRYRIRLSKVYPEKSIKKITVPIFLMHALNDPVINIKAYKKLKEAGKNVVIKTWTPRAGRHTELFKTYPDLYTKKCNQFLNKITRSRQHLYTPIAKANDQVPQNALYLKGESDVQKNKLFSNLTSY